MAGHSSKTMSAILGGGHPVARMRDSCGPLAAGSLFSCMYDNCTQPTRKFGEHDPVQLLTLDHDQGPGAVPWHSQCWAQYQEHESLLYAALHVVLPVELLRKEEAAGRRPADYVERVAPSTLRVAMAYDVQCPQLLVSYAAPDVAPTDETLPMTGIHSYAVSVPPEAVARVPVEAAVINECTFAQLFRKRALVTIAMRKSLDIERLNKAVVAVMADVMQSSLTVAQRRAFKITEKAPMEVVGHACQAVVFRHAFLPKAGDAQITYHKLVVDLAFPAAQLAPTLFFFHKSFLDPDGDTLRDGDRLTWAELFGPVAPRREQASSNGSRQFVNRTTWATKLQERRAFLSDTMQGVVKGLTDKLALGATVTRDAANDFFCSDWHAAEYLVNAQPVETFRTADDLHYVVAADMKSLLCCRYESTEAKANRFEYLPCVWAEDTAPLEEELAVRKFAVVNKNEVEQVFASGGL
jgi:hypothetical protein